MRRAKRSKCVEKKNLLAVDNCSVTGRKTGHCARLARKWADVVASCRASAARLTRLN